MQDTLAGGYQPYRSLETVLEVHAEQTRGAGAATADAADEAAFASLPDLPRDSYTHVRGADARIVVEARDRSDHSSAS